MTKTLTLAAQVRVPSRQGNRELESERRVLGVVYGHGFDPVSVSVDASDVLRAYRQLGTSTVLDLDIDGKKMAVLMKIVNLHPVRHEINHVDFFAVNMKERAIVNIDLVVVGESPAVKLGGILVSAHKSLNIKCLPADSPRNIEVDVSYLKVNGDHITIADLGLDPKKYEIVGLGLDEVVYLVSAQRVVKEAEVSENVEGADAEEKTAE